MPAMKRDAIRVSIRSQLMNDPQGGTLLLLNLMKLFADRKDDAEFVRELADLASDLTSAAMENSYSQQPYPQPPSLFGQPLIPFPDDDMNQMNPQMIPSVGDFRNMTEKPAKNQISQEKGQAPQAVAGDVMSALNELGQDTTSYQRVPSNEPVIQGYTEWSPRPKKNKNNKS